MPVVGRPRSYGGSVGREQHVAIARLKERPDAAVRRRRGTSEGSPSVACRRPTGLLCFFCVFESCVSAERRERARARASLALRLGRPLKRASTVSQYNSERWITRLVNR